MSSEYNTSYSLLERALKSDDQDAWGQIKSKYENFIFYLLRKMSFPDEMVDDVAQMVIIDLFKNLKKYDSSLGKFRPWFSILVKNRAIQEYRKLMAYRKKMGMYSDFSSGFIESFESPEVEGKIEQNWESYITDLAFQRVGQSFRGSAVECFKLSLEGVSVPEIAARYNLTENTVYSYRRRVTQSLRIEVKRLIDELEYRDAG